MDLKKWYEIFKPNESVRLTYFDKSVYIINWITEDDFDEMEDDIKEWWKNYFKSEKYRKRIYFHQLIWVDWISKTKAIEAPKIEYKEKNTEEREKLDNHIKDVLAKTYDWRKKNFYKKREKILERLAIDEASFNMETTLDQLEDYKQLKLQHDKNKLRGC